MATTYRDLTKHREHGKVKKTEGMETNYNHEQKTKLRKI